MNKKAELAAPFFLLALFFLFSSCGAAPSRNPTSRNDKESVARQIQNIDLQLATLWGYLWNQALTGNEKSARKSTDKEIRALAENRDDALARLASDLDIDDWSGKSAWFETSSEASVRRVETFAIANHRAYQIGQKPPPPFPLENRLFAHYELKLLNRTFLHKQSDSRESNADERESIPAKMECDAEFVHPDGFFGQKQKKSRSYEFAWPNGRKNGANVKLGFPAEVSECRLLFKEKKSQDWAYAVNFKALDQIQPEWRKLSQYLEVCPQATGFEKRDAISFFWDQGYPHISCAQEFDAYTQLRDPFDAFNAKMRNLTGENLSRNEFLNRNPEAALDVTRAPRYDILWVSSLNFTADFYGSTLARALRFHADRGTQVRVLLPRALVLGKDKFVLEKLVDGHPNVKLQLYEFNRTNGQNGTRIDELHRVMHAKLLMGYSKQNPKLNFVVTGGRNIRDSYLFHTKPNYKKYPLLINYAEGARPFIYYDDFEVEVRGESVVRSILAQMLSLWNRDLESNLMRPTSLHVRKSASAAQLKRLRSLAERQSVMRHVLSLPYGDDQKLEKFYVDLLDSAQEEILLTTPYFRPPDSISEALNRAAARGVKIKVLTRISLAGDGSTQIAEFVNKDGVNRHFGKFEIFEWTDPNSILHAKLIVVDRTLSFVSSINWNQRSFLHDVESGVLVLGRRDAEELRAEILEYLKLAQPITQKFKVRAFNKALLNWVEEFF